MQTSKKTFSARALFTAAFMGASMGLTALPAQALTLPAPLHADAQKNHNIVLAQFGGLQGNGSFQNFSLDLDGGRLTADDFSFEGLRSTDSQFEATRFNMRNVRIEMGGEVHTIADVSLENVSFDATSFVDDESILGFLGVLAQSRASRASITGVEINAPEITVNVGSMNLQNLSGGIMQSISIADVTLAGDDDGSMIITSFQATDLNARKLIDIFDSANYAEERTDNVEKLLGGFSLQGLVINVVEDGQTTSGTIERMSAGEVRGRQFLFEPDILLDIFSDAPMAFDNTDLAIEIEWALLVFNEAISFGALEISGLALAGADGGTQTNLSIESIALSEYSLDAGGSGSVSGVSIRVDDDGDIIVASLEALEVGPGRLYTEEGIASFRANPVDAVDYTEFAKSYRRQIIKNFSVRNLAVTYNDAPLAVMEDFSGTSVFENGIYSSAGALTSLRVNLISLQEVSGDEDFLPLVIQVLGYEEMDFSLVGSGYYDGATQTLGYEQLDLILADGGTLGLKVVLGNLPEEILGYVVPEEQVMAFMDGSIVSGEVFYEDDGLADRLLELGAMMSGSNLPQLKAQITAGASMFALQLGDPRIAQQVAAAIATFIDNPQSLTLRLAPSQPVPISSLAESAEQGPAAVIRQVNATLSANE